MRSAGAVADHLILRVDFLPQRAIRGFGAIAGELLLDPLEQNRLGERLLDESGRALVARLEGVLRRAVPRHHHDRHGGVRGFDALEHLEAVHARHLDVEEHEIGRVALDQRQALLSGRRADELVALILERPAHRVADADFIVDDEDSGFHVRPRVDADRANRSLVGPGSVDVDGQHVARIRGAREPVVGVGRIDGPPVDLHARSGRAECPAS